MNKIILSLLSLFILIIAAILIVPSFIDWSQYKDRIITETKKATGYDLSINGELRAAFLPSPHVIMNNVGIDSADVAGPYGFNGEIKRASVSLSLLPLLSGDIVVDTIDIETPILNVREQAYNPESNAQDTVIDNIEEQNTQAESEMENNTTVETENQSAMVKIDNLTVRDAAISYQALQGEAMTIQFPELNLAAENLMGPYDFDGQLLYEDFNIHFDGETGAEFSQNEPLPLSVTINGKGYDIAFNGIADMSKTVADMQGELSLKANSIQEIATKAGMNDLQITDQSVAFSGMLQASSELVKLNNGMIEFGKAPNPMPIAFDFMPQTKKGALSLQNIPGGGSLVLDITSGDSTRLSGDINIQSFKALTSDWLGIVDAQTFANPQIPTSARGDINISLADIMTLKSSTMALGQYKLSNTNITYKQGEPGSIDLSIGNFEGATIKASGTMNMEEGIKVNVSHPNAAKFIKVFQPEFEASPITSQSFAFSGTILTEGDIVQVEGMNAKIGGIDANGSLSMDNSKTIPSIKANLTFGNLDTKALLTGEKSVATQTGGGAKSSPSNTASSQSSGSPWTRDAIDTSGLRSINLDLNAKASQLVHGTWIIQNPVIDIDLQNGGLTINEIKGGLFGGNVDMSGQINAKSDGQPLTLSSKINATNVNLSTLTKAALSQSKERVVGTGSFNIDLNTQGLSSSALIYGLNATGNMTTSALTINGIDLAKVTEAIADESLTDLASVVRGAFNNGATQFEAINHNFKITEGTMPIDNFTLKSSTANLITNGEVSFSRWIMDLKNTVDFTNPDDLPSVDMTIKGPLNAPQQNVATDVLRSFIMNKYGAKIQNKVDKLLGDKLKDTPASGLINNLLGLPTTQQKQVEPASDENASITTTPSTPPSTSETEPSAKTTVEEPQPSIEEQVIKGLFDQIGR